ncbi:MAG: exonuclease domain-containing protein [Roseburia sp.]|nr:exonuclease domain-containing protein [Roseburia sp.]
MNYIVLDLEWNQSSTGLEEEVSRLPFEIVEIGAIKLNDRNIMVSEFSELVKPQIYREMHYFTSKLIHLQMQELERGRFFPEVAESFLNWCGEEEYLFCSWGASDLVELQRNREFYHMEPLSEGPIRYLDVQKLFAIAYEERKLRRSLEYAIDFLGIKKDIPFHRAFSDAYYTAKILSCILEQKPEVLQNVSYDVYHPPGRREDEVKVQFDGYYKYISRVFADKQAAFADREVSSSKCYLCHRNLRKKIRWFTVNGRHYYCAAYCEEHGYLKGKIRLHKAEGGVFVIKTTKFIEPKDMELLLQRQQRAKQLRRKRKTNPIK